MPATWVGCRYHRHPSGLFVQGRGGAPRQWGEEPLSLIFRLAVSARREVVAFRGPTKGRGAAPRTGTRNVGERHEHAFVLVPQRELRAGQAAPQGQALGAPAQLRVLQEAVAQAVARDPARQMMDVMEADVVGDPVQRARQVVERAPLERGGADVSARLGFPVRGLELVLHVE